MQYCSLDAVKFETHQTSVDYRKALIYLIEFSDVNSRMNLDIVHSEDGIPVVKEK